MGTPPSGGEKIESKGLHTYVCKLVIVKLMTKTSVYNRDLKRWMASCPVCRRVIRNVRCGTAFRSFVWHVTNCVERSSKTKPRLKRNESGRNQEFILHAVRKMGTVTRSELVKETGLSKNTVISHTKTLIESAKLNAKEDWSRGWVYSIREGESDE